MAAAAEHRDFSLRADSAGPDRDNARHRLRFHDDEDRGVRRPAATAFHPLCAQQRQPDRCGRAGIARVARCLPDGGRRSGRGGQLRNGLRRGSHQSGLRTRRGRHRDHRALPCRQRDNARRVVYPRHRRTRHEGHFRRARRRNAHGDQRSLFVGLRFVHRDLRPEPRLRGRGVRGAGVHRLPSLRPGDALHRFYELPREADAARGSFDGRYRRRAFLLGRKELPLQSAEAPFGRRDGRPDRRAGRHDAQRRRGAGFRTADRARGFPQRPSGDDGRFRLRALCRKASVVRRVPRTTARNGFLHFGHAAMPWLREPMHGDALSFLRRQHLLFGKQVRASFFQ